MCENPHLLFIFIFLSYFSSSPLIFSSSITPRLCSRLPCSSYFGFCLLCAVPGRGKALLHHPCEVLCQAAAELLLITANFSLNKLLISSSVIKRLIRLGQEGLRRETAGEGRGWKKKREMEEMEERWRDGHLSVTQLSPCCGTAFQQP